MTPIIRDRVDWRLTDDDDDNTKYPVLRELI